MSPRLLAFDTSTEQMAIGLCDGEREWLALETGGAMASARLLPSVHELLAAAGLELSDLHAVAFGRGPGAFTGLRTSCAVAQGLALGLACPVVPLDSLALVAEDARMASGIDDIAVAMDARMDEVYAGRFRFDGARWHAVDAPALYALATLAEHWSGSTLPLLCGSALSAFGQRLALRAGQQHPQAHNRAAALMRLARQEWAAGVRVAADDALPLYLRDKVALTTAERAFSRAAA